MRIPLCGLLLAAGLNCQASPEQQAFWNALQTHCGKSYAGRLVEPQPQDAQIAAQSLRMQVRDCSANEIRIPFEVGSDRSRTWVLTRMPQGLRLKHEHRHEDGSEDRISQYGGDSRGTGTATAQDFPADAHTAALIPAAATNTWSLLLDERGFSYRLTRPGTPARRFEARFDFLTPPPESRQ